MPDTLTEQIIGALRAVVRPDPVVLDCDKSKCVACIILVTPQSTKNQENPRYRCRPLHRVPSNEVAGASRLRRACLRPLQLIQFVGLAGYFGDGVKRQPTNFYYAIL